MIRRIERPMSGAQYKEAFGYELKVPTFVEGRPDWKKIDGVNIKNPDWKKIYQ